MLYIKLRQPNSYFNGGQESYCDIELVMQLLSLLKIIYKIVKPLYNGTKNIYDKHR